jgi:hypothetical protein
MRRELGDTEGSAFDGSKKFLHILNAVPGEPFE